jgi:hypothetical protein
MRVAVFVLIASVSLAGQTSQPTVERARELYYAAAYDEALVLLDDIDVTNPGDVSTVITVESVRAACLFALGRADEAEDAFKRLVTAAPDVMPEQLNMTPWITSRFAAVRARALPRIGQHERAPAMDQSALAVVLEAPEFYTVEDPMVSPPVAIRENIPEPPARKVDFTGTATLEVDITIDGSIERVTVNGAIHPSYAELLRQAAATWRYQPATLNARPVKFRKALRIEIR